MQFLYHYEGYTTKIFTYFSRIAMKEIFAESRRRKAEGTKARTYESVILNRTSDFRYEICDKSKIANLNSKINQVIQLSVNDF